MIVPIGKMDRRIRIEALTKGQGSRYGEPTESWVEFATVWANVYSGGGREFQAAQHITAEIDTQFQIRYIAGLTPTMRLLFDGRYYDIFRLQELGRRRRINIWAKARLQ